MVLFSNPVTIAQGAPGAPAYLYIAWASDDVGTDFTTTFDPLLDYVALKVSYSVLTPAVGDFVGLWKNYKGTQGVQGGQGVPGSSGSSSYSYVAFASDDIGTDFSLVPGSGLDYVAFKTTASPLSPPIASDFVGLWKNYAGIPGPSAAAITSIIPGIATIPAGSDHVHVLHSCGSIPNFISFIPGLGCEAFVQILDSEITDTEFIIRFVGGVILAGDAEISWCAFVGAFNNGSGTILAGQDHVHVTHLCGSVPLHVSVSPGLGCEAPIQILDSDITSTEFVVRFVGGVTLSSNANFKWGAFK